MTADKAAFPNLPCQIQDGNMRRVYEPTPGMSMRQYYKAAALTGMLANSAIAEHNSFSMSGLCAEAGHYADALLAEDEQHEKSAQ